MRGSRYAEQPESLVSILEDIDLHCGDVADVELIGVGIRTVPETSGNLTRLAFCPVSEVLLNKCNRQKRRHTLLTPCVHFARTSRKEIHRIQGQQGFAHAACRIHATEGELRIARLRILTFEEFNGPVHYDDSYKQFLHLAN